ncbi:MAG: DUF89 family protein, partial [Chitinivibrionales bacterium]|nr:DUF89 family protein [Chitinivibrionales bacterium]MBD3358484.1 DUF89 family protein [Chitinivibrionales bacterium]
MKTYYECLPCFVRQALTSLKRSGASDERTQEAMRAVFRELASLDYEATPPEIAGGVYDAVGGAIGSYDPYARDKALHNDFALALLPHMQKRLRSEADRFEAKIKLAIAANIIDLGKDAGLRKSDVQNCFDRALETPVDQSALSSLRTAVHEADTILYLCDNAGEIVFDRFLIEEMPHTKVKAVVRGCPVINDATLQDARCSGLADLVKVITNGSGAPGTVLRT